MRIPKTVQLPIRQPMYVNGLMHQVWIDFFEKLASLGDEGNLIDLIELMQRVAELPSQAIQAQQGYDIAAMQNTVPVHQTHNQHKEYFLPPVSISSHQEAQQLPPIQAVFLCPQQAIPALNLPGHEVITSD